MSRIHSPTAQTSLSTQTPPETRKPGPYQEKTERYPKDLIEWFNDDRLKHSSLYRKVRCIVTLKENFRPFFVAVLDELESGADPRWAARVGGEQGSQSLQHSRKATVPPIHRIHNQTFQHKIAEVPGYTGANVNLITIAKKLGLDTWTHRPRRTELEVADGSSFRTCGTTYNVEWALGRHVSGELRSYSFHVVSEEDIRYNLVLSK